MSRAVPIAGAGLASVVVVLWAAQGAHAALVTGAILAAIAAAALGVAQLAAVRRQRLGSLGRQFGVAIALLVSQALVAVIAVAALMFVSDSDAVLVSLIVAFTGLVAVLAARRLAGGVLRDVEALRDGLAAVGAGRRDVHIPNVAALSAFVQRCLSPVSAPVPTLQ